MKTLLFHIILSLLTFFGFADIVSVDKMVHDWGDVTVKDGALECDFTIVNTSDRPQKILNVVKSCGCTSVYWPKEAFSSGESVRIHVVYSNDEGPHSFDKSISVYFEGVKGPLVLRIRGDVFKEKIAIEKSYPVHYEGIGLKKGLIKIGNLSQGEQKSTDFTVANVSGEDLSLSWKDVDAHLSIYPSEISIKAGQTARLSVSVRADRKLWGKNFYHARPVVCGRAAEDVLSFWAVSKENFDSWSEEQMAAAPKAALESLVESSPCLQGESMEVRYLLTNKGKSPLEIYKVEYDQKALESSVGVGKLEAGEERELAFRVKTENFEKDSDNTILVTFYTNDPNHPLLHLYIDAIIL